ncbi:sorting nexin-8-like [Clytia hemisphaerica]|uniref:sorting nexin-8-like n=1 Tax=Clytia hemisphaerica TaxID=252671 RepID=UPI0034D602EA|eukprot:TCONS_00022627-protein
MESDKDLVSVELEPEKKGLVLKHRMYTVTSTLHKANVQRRYNDFIAFHEVLLLRYPYRLVPRLPPKKIVANTEFIEGRRRALKRFLVLILRHPAIGKDPIVNYFLTFKGSDAGHKLKEQYKGVPDEFMTNEMASSAKDNVPADTQASLTSSRQQLYFIHKHIEQMKDILERLGGRSTAYAVDMLSFSKNLQALSEESNPVTEWATGGNKTWQKLQRGFKSLVVPFASIAEKSAMHSTHETEGVSDYLEMFMDITAAYKELVERHEKGVLRDHHMALHKMQQYKQRQMSTAMKGNENMDQLEHRIIAQEGAISNMENRNYFSLYCLQEETRFIHSNMNMVVKMFQNLVDIEIRKHTELCTLWDDMRQPINHLAESANTPGSPVSPDTSSKSFFG